MANRIKGEVSLEYAGETFILQFGFEALVLVEDRRGKAFGGVVEELNEGRLGAIGALFWAGVQAHHPEVTFEAAGRMIIDITEGGRGLELQNKIIEAITLAFPKAKAKAKGEGATGEAGPQTEATASTSSDA